MKHPASFMQTEKECYLCKKLGRENTYELEKHHIFEGPRRNASEETGAWVWLCHAHHTADPHSAHMSGYVNRRLKEIAQKRFEKTHTRGEFMAIFHENYLLEDM